MPTVTIQDFHADVRAAEAASERGPVFITEEGEPRLVLLDVVEYRKLAGVQLIDDATSPAPEGDLASLLAVPDDEYFEWEPPRLQGPLFEPADFS